MGCKIAVILNKSAWSVKTTTLYPSILMCSALSACQTFQIQTPFFQHSALVLSFPPTQSIHHAFTSSERQDNHILRVDRPQQLLRSSPHPPSLPNSSSGSRPRHRKSCSSVSTSRVSWTSSSNIFPSQTYGRRFLTSYFVFGSTSLSVRSQRITVH